MKHRIPLIVAVVGALLIGGATTGSTRASWVDQVSLTQHAVSSGHMSYTATTPAGVTVTRAAGSTADTTIVIDDTSLGKTLTQRTTATVAGTPAGITATVRTTCGGITSHVDTTPTSADQSFCVRVTSSTTAVSGTVTINLTSVQRPTGGWSTSTISRSVAVTVNSPVAPPLTPTITCQSRSGSTISFTWSTVAGVTYTVHQATTNADASYSSGSAPSGTGSHTLSPASDSTTYYRLKASNADGTSGFSNTVQVSRANGASTITCTPVTP